MNNTAIRHVRSAGWTIARVLLGVELFAQGWRKFFTKGIDRVQDGFDAMGIPFADVVAWFAATVELVGGAALVIGLAVPVAAALGVVVVLGALVYGGGSAMLATRSILESRGAETALLVLAGLAAIALLPPTALSVDHHLPWRIPRV